MAMFHSYVSHYQRVLEFIGSFRGTQPIPSRASQPWLQSPRREVQRGRSSSALSYSYLRCAVSPAMVVVVVVVLVVVVVVNVVVVVVVVVAIAAVAVVVVVVVVAVRSGHHCQSRYPPRKKSHVYSY